MWLSSKAMRSPDRAVHHAFSHGASFMQRSLASIAVLALSSLGAGCQAHESAPPASPNSPAAQSAPSPAAVPTLAAAPTPQPPPAYGGPVVEVPAGSRLVLRVDDPVDSGRMGAGQRFRSSLDAALLDQSGKVVVPARTRVLGVILETQHAGHVAGKSEVEIAFTDLDIGGVLFPIQSQGVKAVGEGSGGGTVRKVAAGALIGGAIGGGKGAAQGAAVGGAVAILTRGKEVKIPSGTILELTLAAPVKVPAPEGSSAITGGEAGATSAASATPSSSNGSTATSPAAATTSAGKPAPSAEPDKACIKKLMDTGFTADEAVNSCKKDGKK
jgi:hypothetical protein